MALARISALVCLSITASVLAGCGGGSNAPDPVRDPDPVIETRTVELADYVSTSLRYVQAFSEDYSVPSIASLNEFDSLVNDLVNQDLDAVQAAAGDVNFRLLRIIDSGAGNNELYCLEEVTLRGQGFYCADFDSLNLHHISAPHPLFDGNTNIESVVVMRGTGARFLSVSSTHRCSNSATSSCSGTTSVCGAHGAYKVSDPAHNVNSFFHHFGTVVHDSNASTHTMQLHGCGSAACPANNDDADIVARLSAGTTDDLAATELVNVLNAELNEELAPFQLGTSLSCSEPSADKQLCGTTNPLGRYINGQPDPCQNSASVFTDSRWLHIEQNSNLRRDDGGGDAITPSTLARAINGSFGGVAVDVTELTGFATRYATAWSSQDPAAFAGFYAENGSLTINDGEPSVGRDAVEQTAQEFMTAFPDMVVKLIDVRREGDRVNFYWHWTGTNTGPGGTGNAVDLRGYESWTLHSDGLILESLGRLDDAEYQRQLSVGAEGE